MYFVSQIQFFATRDPFRFSLKSTLFFVTETWVDSINHRNLSRQDINILNWGWSSSARCYDYTYQFWDRNGLWITPYECSPSPARLSVFHSMRIWYQPLCFWERPVNDCDPVRLCSYFTVSLCVRVCVNLCVFALVYMYVYMCSCICAKPCPCVSEVVYISFDPSSIYEQTLQQTLIRIHPTIWHKHTANNQ